MDKACLVSCFSLLLYISLFIAFLALVRLAFLFIAESAWYRRHFAKKNPDSRDTGSQSRTANGDAHSNGTAARQATSSFASGGRLALFLFFGSFLGSLIGVASDFKNAQDLVVDAVAWFDPSPQLNIVGSDTVLGEKLEMAEAWKKNFVELTKWKQDIGFQTITRKVDVNIHPIGSHKGLEAAGQGKVHLLAMSDPMTPEQRQKLEANHIKLRCAAEIGYDIIVFVTDLNNNVPAFSRYALKNILRGNFSNWSQISDRAEKSRKIQILAREGSGTTHFILHNFLGEGEFPEHFIPCDSNELCLDTALSIPGSMYWGSAAWLYTQPPRYVHPLLIRRDYDQAPQNPLNKYFDANNYPGEMLRGLYMYVLDGPDIDPKSSELAKEFFLYVRGIHGQAILEKSHFYTYLKPPAEVKLALPQDFGIRQPGTPPVACLY